MVCPVWYLVSCCELPSNSGTRVWQTSVHAHVFKKGHGQSLGSTRRSNVSLFPRPSRAPTFLDYDGDDEQSPKRLKRLRPSVCSVDVDSSEDEAIIESSVEPAGEELWAGAGVSLARAARRSFLT